MEGVSFGAALPRPPSKILLTKKLIHALSIRTVQSQAFVSCEITLACYNLLVIVMFVSIHQTCMSKWQVIPHPSASSSPYN